MSEGQVVNDCLQWLWAHGCYVYRQNTGAYKPEGSSRFIRYGTPGASDLVGLTKAGRFIAVECKMPKGKLSDLQAAFKERIESHNGIFILARGIEDLEVRKSEILAPSFPTR